MGPRGKIRVLIVDDSMFFREVLSKGLASGGGIEVVGTANDSFEARDKILEYEPDVMTCDIQMPKMNGIEFIRRLLPQYPLPVIVVSTLSNAVFDAMNAGAVDFVVKPDVGSVKSVGNFIADMIQKVKIASQAKVVGTIKEQDHKKVASISSVTNSKIIAIGASTGGTEAIFNILRYLPANVPGIVVVQHIPPGFSRMFAERLNTTTSLAVKEGESGDRVERGRVIIAPGHEHMRVKRLGDLYKVECFAGEKVNGHCPSVDVLFQSVALAAGDKGIGVILTGMGYDGARGLLMMRRKGARTLGQDEKTSVVYGMPKVAFDIKAVERQVSLDILPHLLYSLSMGR